MVIYMATNRINGMEYIGQTINSLACRRQAHINKSLYKKDNSYFHNSIRKYGKDNFDWEILHDNITNIDDLNSLEIYYIGYYDTFNNGYNLDLGGRNALMSEETKNKMSKAAKGKYVGKDNPNYGNKWSDKQKKKISDLNKNSYAGKSNHKAQMVIINGKYFDTVTEASEFIGIVHSSIRYRILHKTKWLGYKYSAIKA